MSVLVTGLYSRKSFLSKPSLPIPTYPLVPMEKPTAPLRTVPLKSVFCVQVFMLWSYSQKSFKYEPEYPAPLNPVPM